MPRISRALAVLDDELAALKTKHAALLTEQAAVEDSLERLKRMRAAMQALPKRTSKAKNRVAAAANAAPPTATAA